MKDASKSTKAIILFQSSLCCKDFSENEMAEHIEDLTEAIAHFELET